jgi:hypothetical protein
MFRLMYSQRQADYKKKEVNIDRRMGLTCGTVQVHRCVKIRNIDMCSVRNRLWENCVICEVLYKNEA